VTRILLIFHHTLGPAVFETHRAGVSMSQNPKSSNQTIRIKQGGNWKLVSIQHSEKQPCLGAKEKGQEHAYLCYF
jgi:hypothetical protein